VPARASPRSPRALPSGADGDGRRPRARRPRARRVACDRGSGDDGAERRGVRGRRGDRRSCRRTRLRRLAAARLGTTTSTTPLPVRERSIWPWLLAILLVAGAAIAGFYVYNQIQDQLNQAKPIGVPVSGRDQGGERRPEHPRRRARGRPDSPPAERPGAEDVRLRPEPEPGRPRWARAASSSLGVDGQGSGDVPEPRRRNRDDAVRELTRRTEGDVHDISSSKPGHRDRAESAGGTKVAEKTTVRINVSSGPKPSASRRARAALRDRGVAAPGAGFAVARQDAESDQPRAS
jgi:hypothetical protein